MGASSSKKNRDTTATKSNSSTPRAERYSSSSRNISNGRNKSNRASANSPQSQSHSHSHTVSPKPSRTRERPSPRYCSDENNREFFAETESGRRKEGSSKGNSGGVGGAATHANYSNDYRRFIESCRSPRQKGKRGNSALSVSPDSQQNHRGPVQKVEETTTQPCDELLHSPCASEAAGSPSRLSTSHRTMGSSSAAAVSASVAAVDDHSSSRTRSALQSARAVLPPPLDYQEEEEEEPVWSARGPPHVSATSSRTSRSGSSARSCPPLGMEGEDNNDNDGDDIAESRSRTPLEEQQQEEEEEEEGGSSPLSLSFDIDLSGVGTAVPGDEDMSGCLTQKSSFSSFNDTDLQAFIFREYAARRQASKLSSRSSHSSKATSRISIRTMPHHRIEVVVPADICDRLPSLVKDTPPVPSEDASVIASKRHTHSLRNHKTTATAAAASSSSSAPAAESEGGKKPIRQHVFSFTRSDMSGASLPYSYKQYRAKHLQQNKSTPPLTGVRKHAGRVCVHSTHSRSSVCGSSDTNSLTNSSHMQRCDSSEARRAAMAACYSFFASTYRDPNRGVNGGNNNTSSCRGGGGGGDGEA